MSKRRRASHYLADILEAMRRILEYTDKLSFDAFMQHHMVQDAVLRNLQVIGEATKKVSDNVRARYPQVPWRDMAGLRDRIVRDYFGIDYQIVWSVIQRDLPALLPVIEAVLKEATEQEI